MTKSCQRLNHQRQRCTKGPGTVAGPMRVVKSTRTINASRQLWLHADSCASTVQDTWAGRCSTRTTSRRGCRCLLPIVLSDMIDLTFFSRLKMILHWPLEAFTVSDSQTCVPWWWECGWKSRCCPAQVGPSRDEPPVARSRSGSKGKQTMSDREPSSVCKAFDSSLDYHQN